jgi:2-polyprenyl-6-methoxyphenol hydroxylase-like FAD-dependent oxidoreductase
MVGFGWETRRILSHLDDTPDFYLDQVAQVVMDRWSSGRVGLIGDAAFSASPMSGAGTGLALVGAYMLAGELAAAGWDPEAGFAGYEQRMRAYVEANQAIGRMHAQMLAAPDPDAEPRPEPARHGGPHRPDRARGRGPRAARLRRRAGLQGTRTALEGLIVASARSTEIPGRSSERKHRGPCTAPLRHLTEWPHG